MKQVLLFILFAFMLTNCAFQKEKNPDIKNWEQNSGTINEPDQAISLADHLRRVAGVSVKGNDQNATVTIRGISSINSGTEPLFILNGQPVSGGFSQLYSMVPVNDIKTIRVLKNPSETGIYGVRGANGVIEIDLK